jgi:toxin ParE1/3/4
MAHSYSPRALRDIEAISEYLAASSPSGASNVLKRIEDVAAMLGEYPQSGRATSRPNIRVYSLGNYPYLLFFRPITLKRDVYILHVRHAARKPLHMNEEGCAFIR